ncbi:MAG: hypothetical protein KAS32_04000 [Candidatus Peribacteraceae bacterium]|nr:hypothetical protein [Candidatus Peribacteraceae bacterium]
MNYSEKIRNAETYFEVVKYCHLDHLNQSLVERFYEFELELRDIKRSLMLEMSIMWKRCDLKEKYGNITTV